jgi:aspartate/tyrosine/aromatic aminotransferase
MPIFSVEEIPPDPILKIPPLYRQDPRPCKLNLGVGAYRTEEGRPFLFSAVKEAEKHLFSQTLDKEYLPIEGDLTFLSLSQRLLFSEEETKNCVSVQTIGGSCALRLAADFLTRVGLKRLYLPDLTWPNHENILGNTLEIASYPYYDQETLSLQESALLDALAKMPKSSIVLLHGCCHNPTGVDPSASLWKKIAAIMQEKELLPLFDVAYQGFASSIEEDRSFLRPFIDSGQTFFVAYSYSKNMGLYGERIGHLTYFSKDKHTFLPVLSHFRRLVRKHYSSPCLHGARIVETVLENPQLTALWKEELTQAKGRIDKIRNLLAKELGERFSKKFEKICGQRGLFALFPLSAAQVERLQNDFAIYMPSSGRFSLAGLSEKTLPYFLEALSSVYPR